MERKLVMKLRKNNKKGFTIVELVIVIAVIGILTAILVPVFINLTNKANEASDQSLVKNLNTAMSMEEGEGKKNNTYHDAIEYLDDYGYKLANLATKAENDLLWNSKTNRFLLNEASAFNKDQAETGAADYEYWTIKDSIPNGNKFSIYAGRGWDEVSAVAIDGVGFDAGYHALSSVAYTNSSNDTRKVTIRTTGGTLTVGASGEGNEATGSIYHYGSLDEAIVYTTNNSFHTHGKIASMDLKKGLAVAEDKGYVALIKAAAGTEIEEKDTGVFYIPSNAVPANIDTDIATELGYKTSAGKLVIDPDTPAGQKRAETVAANPYEIANIFDLKVFRDAVNKGDTFVGITVKVINDIDLENKQWTPIGIKWENTATNYAAYPLLEEQGITSASIFSGIFEGNNHIISGLLIENAYYGALFGRIGNATIQNLTVEGRVYGQDSAGVVGRAGSGTVTLSHVTANVTVGIDPQSEIQGKGKTGGLVAYADCTQLNIEYCVNKGNISSHNANAYCAGLVAGSGSCNINISHSKNEGNVSATGSDARVGGLIGRFAGHASNIKSLSITDSSNSGSITMQGGGSFSYVGGIIGAMNDEPSHLGTLNIQRVTNEGDVNGIPTGTPEYSPNVKNVVYVGGIFGNAGLNQGLFEDVANTGAISGMIVGGIGGNLAQQKTNNAYVENAISLSNCVNSGSVTGTYKTGMNYVCVAGLLGNVGNGYITINETCSAKDATITATVSGDVNAVCRLVGNIINDHCKNLTVHISETFDGDTLNTFGKIGTTIFDNNGNPSGLKYYGTMIGSIVNVNGLSTVTDMD